MFWFWNSKCFRWTIPEIKSCNCNSALLYEPQLGKNWPSKKQFCYRFSSSNFRKDLPFCHHSFVEVRQEPNQITIWTWWEQPKKDKKKLGMGSLIFFLCQDITNFLLIVINNNWNKVQQKFHFLFVGKCITSSSSFVFENALQPEASFW